MRSAVGIFDVSHLGKLVVRGDGRGGVPEPLPEQRPRPDRARARRSTPWPATPTTGGVVDDLIAYYRDDDHVLLVPNAANSAEVKRRLEAERPDGVTDHRPPRVPRRAGGAGHRVRRGARGGRPAGRARLHVLRAWRPFEGARGRGLPHRLHRRARLRAGRRQRGGAGALGRAARGGGAARDRCRAASAPATRCAPRWATRCTARTSASTSRPSRRGSAGPSAGPSPTFWGKEALLAEKEAGARVTLRGLVAQGRGIARPQMSVKVDPGPAGRPRHLGHVLARPCARASPWP